MNKVLITGGAGFIGSKLSLELKKRGYQVTVLDNFSNQIHGNNPEITSPLFNSIKNEVKIIVGDIRDSLILKTAIADNEIIVHFAAETGTGQSMYQINKYVDVNIGGTAKLLEVLATSQNKVRKIIIASSRALYGEGKYECKEHGIVYPNSRLEKDMKNGDFSCKCPKCNSILILLPTTEDSKINPSSVYGITKQNQEQLIMTVCPTIGISPVAFRYQNVYGPGQSLSNPYTGILSIFSTQIKNNNNLNIFEDGKESRDFVYIDDVIDATILGIEKESANNLIFNVGSGVPTDVITVAQNLIKNYQSNIIYNINGSFRIGDIRNNYADLSLIKEKLTFSPKFEFNEGMKLFCKWVDNQEIFEDKYEQSINEMIKNGIYK